LEETNVEGILKFDVSSLQMNQSSYKTYLIYNPHEEAENVAYKTTSSDVVDLFDAVSETKVAHSVDGETMLSLDAKESMVLTEIVEGEKIMLKGSNYVDESDHVLTQIHVSTGLLNHANGETVKDTFTLRIGHVSPIEDDAITHISMTVNEQTFTVHDSNEITIDTANLHSKGARRFSFEIEMESGLKDSFSQILRIEKDS